MKSLTYLLLLFCSIGFTACDDDDREEDELVETEFLSTGLWHLNEVRGIGSWTSTGDSGELSGTFDFRDTDPTTLAIDFDVLPNRMHDSGYLTGNWIFSPDPLNLSEYGQVYDNLPVGGYAYDGTNIHINNGLRQFDGIVDAAFADELIYTVRIQEDFYKSNLGNSDQVITDGLYTFYYIR